MQNRPLKANLDSGSFSDSLGRLAATSEYVARVFYIEKL